MEKISYDLVSQIQKKVNIVDVISEYLPLEQRGKNYFAICPFHDDHNPSMSISPEKQIYTCFVCGASGNVFNFVMNYEKISFVDAVTKVGAKVGILISNDIHKKNIKKGNKYEKYYKIYDIVNKFYQNNIKSSYGKKARMYLKERNITDDVIKTFEIGLSLNDNNVSKLLKSKGFLDEDLEFIGICGIKDKFLYDTYRNRIMFPLYNTSGDTVGFSGRIYNGEDINKYLNSKESPIFKKGTLLYNYHRAIMYAKEKKSIIVVEGFMDVIRLYTIGVKNVVATMGTAITKEHANLIKRLSKNVILCFDGDKAGEKATSSAIFELEKIGITPKIIRLEDDLDPDDYVIKKGKDKFLNHLKMPITTIEYQLDINKKQTNFNDVNEISSYVKKASKELSKIDDEVVYELMLKKISKESGVSYETIKDIAGKEIKKEKKVINKRKIKTSDKYEKAEEYLIYYMLRNPDAILVYQNNVSYLSNKKLSRIAMEILEFYEINGYINTLDFTLYLQDKTDLINEVLRIDEYKMPVLINNDQLLDYVKTIDEKILKDEIIRLKDEIKQEVSTAKKIVLLEKLTMLKKKECKNERD